MRRRLLTFGLMVMVVAGAPGCAPNTADATGTWRGADAALTLQLDEDGRAEFDALPISYLNLRGPQDALISDVVGTWSLVDGLVVTEFETENGHRELTLRFADAGDRDLWRS